MKGLFNYDNPVMRFIGKFWDVLILNILWMICSIPIFTIGASTTAVYYVTLKLARDDDGYTIRSFFHSFKQNFRQATVIWLIFLMAGIILVADLWFVLTANVVPAGTLRILATALFIGLLVVWFAMMTYVFPILARFYGTIKQTILNSFLLSVRYLLYTIGMIAIDVVIVILTLTSLPVLSLLGIALIAFLNSFLLERIFKKLIPKEERDDQEMRPLFADEELTENGEEPVYQMFIRNEGETAQASAENPAPGRTEAEEAAGDAPAEGAEAGEAETKQPGPGAAEAEATAGAAGTEGPATGAAPAEITGEDGSEEEQKHAE